MSWHWKLMQNLKRKLIRDLKSDIKNLVNFHANSQKLKNLEFDGLPFSKACKDLDKKLQKTHVSWEWRVMQCLKKRLTFASKNDMRNLVNFNASSCKSENLHFDVLLSSVAFKVQIRNYRRMISRYTEEGSKLWRKTHLLFEKGHNGYNEFWL